MRSAEESVTIMTTTQGLVRKMEGFRPLFEELKARGFNFKIINPFAKFMIGSKNCRWINGK